MEFKAIRVHYYHGKLRSSKIKIQWCIDVFVLIVCARMCVWRERERKRERYILPIFWIQLQGRNSNSLHFLIISAFSVALCFLAFMSLVDSDTSTFSHLCSLIQEKPSWLLARVRAHRSSIEYEGTILPTSPSLKCLQWHLQVCCYQQCCIDLYSVTPWNRYRPSALMIIAYDLLHYPRRVNVVCTDELFHWVYLSLVGKQGAQLVKVMEWYKWYQGVCC